VSVFEAPGAKLGISRMPAHGSIHAPVHAVFVQFVEPVNVFSPSSQSTSFPHHNLNLTPAPAPTPTHPTHTHTYTHTHTHTPKPLPRMKSTLVIALVAVALTAMAVPTVAFSRPFQWQTTATPTNLLGPGFSGQAEAAVNTNRFAAMWLQRQREVESTDAGFTITLDTAGFSATELTVRVNDLMLEVTGKHACAESAELCIPRTFERSWDLTPSRVNVSEISVSRTADGAMRITLPKKATSCRKVPIHEIAINPTLPDAAPMAPTLEQDSDATTGSLGVKQEHQEVAVRAGSEIAPTPDSVVVTHTRQSPPVLVDDPVSENGASVQASSTPTAE
jgi:HSP20 family molecular chaperone IbpA